MTHFPQNGDIPSTFRDIWRQVFSPAAKWEKHLAVRVRSDGGRFARPLCLFFFVANETFGYVGSWEDADGGLSCADIFSRPLVDSVGLLSLGEFA